MSKKIEFSRIHAIHWFGYQDVFDIHGNLLIAGVTGSGKSILMDLIQLVLVGDQKSKYNQSATGKASSRTLKSYCLGDTKDEVEGVAQYMRNDGATTYAALEFTWPNGEKIETWGLRIEFESAAQNQPARRHGFVIPGRMDKPEWIDGQGQPLNWNDFRELVQDRGGRVFDTMEAYRREMSLPVHLNFDRETLDYLLPAAMSFTFLENFNRFCRSFVLPPEEVRIQEVRDSYHAFMSLRRELETLRRQQSYLERIRDEFTRHDHSERDRDLFADITRELRCEDLTELVDDYAKSIAELEAKAAGEVTREAHLEREQSDGRLRRDLLRDALNATDDGQLFLHLREENRQLVDEISRLKSSGRTLEEARELRCRQVRGWLETLQQAGLDLPKKSLAALKVTIADVEKGSLVDLGTGLEKLADAVRDFHDVVRDAEKPLRDEVEKKVAAIRRATAQLEGLEQGRISQRSTLLDAVNRAIPRKKNGELAARALRELCEVKDERWRPALEVAFTRKFSVVVATEHYDIAEAIYRDLKGAAPGEALVHPGQALELTPKREKGCLAEKLECTHPVAQKLVDHLFGRLICVEDARHLRDHEAAILPDGFTYRRPFAERRAHYDQIPCIGGKGLDQQRQFLDAERNRLRAELARVQPLAALLEEAERKYRDQRLDSPGLGAQLTDLVRLRDREETLAKNIQRLQAIEGHDFEQKELELRELDRVLLGIVAELKGLRQSELKLQLGQLQGRLDEAREKLERADMELKRYRAEGPNRTLFGERRLKLRADLLAEFPVLEVAADQAARRERECSNTAIESRAALVEARKELARDFPVYQEFAPADESNGPWDERLARILGSDIPLYERKAQREEKNWQELFRKQVMVKLRSALLRVEQTLRLLNKELKKPIGHHIYQIRKARNPDYASYQRLLDNSMLGEEGGLFFESIDVETRIEVERIFQMLVEDPNNREALAFLDYRNYYDYDMSVMDTRDPDGRETSVDRQSGKFSGGESQSPYFIAILACYLRAYHRYERRGKEPSIGLVPIDEAFSKLSGERIRDCIGALKSLGLQGVFSMSSGNIPYAIDLCDQTMVVSKKESKRDTRVFIRNIAVSMTREEAVARFVK
jgi:energy-coupling factor transporter ATP-binding protein EcfA2